MVKISSSGTERVQGLQRIMHLFSETFHWSNLMIFTMKCTYDMREDHFGWMYPLICILSYCLFGRDRFTTLAVTNIDIDQAIPAVTPLNQEVLSFSDTH